MHWDTFGRGGSEHVFPSAAPSLCVNPLTWRADGEAADRRLHLGAVPISGEFAIEMFGDDVGAGTRFDHLQAPMNAYSRAQCENGTLYVEDQSQRKYSELGESPDGSYHGIDFAMFHMNVRENSVRRVRAYFERTCELATCSASVEGR